MMNLSQTIPVLLLGTILAVLSPKLCAAFTIQEVASFAQASRDLPVVKSAGLSPDMDVPWSKAVRIADPFEGEFLGVFDRNSLGGYLYREGSKQVVIATDRRLSTRSEKTEINSALLCAQLCAPLRFNKLVLTALATAIVCGLLQAFEF